MRALMIAAALAFTAAAPVVHAQPKDQSSDQTAAKNAQCQGPDGKDATNFKCKGAGPAPAASAIFKRDAKGQCRDGNGKAVKAENCKPPS
jgi:hypothetical protein